MHWLIACAATLGVAISLSCSGESTESVGPGERNEPTEAGSPDDVSEPSETSDPIELVGDTSPPETVSCDLVALEPGEIDGDSLGRHCLSAAEADSREIEIEFPNSVSDAYCVGNAAEVCPAVDDTGGWLGGCRYRVLSPLAVSLYDGKGEPACCYDIVLDHCL